MSRQLLPQLRWKLCAMAPPPTKWGWVKKHQKGGVLKLNPHHFGLKFSEWAHPLTIFLQGIFSWISWSIKPPHTHQRIPSDTKKCFSIASIEGVVEVYLREKGVTKWIFNKKCTYWNFSEFSSKVFFPVRMCSKVVLEGFIYKTTLNRSKKSDIVLNSH